MLVRTAFRRVIKRPHHFVPIAEGFGAAVPSGGWGMFPDRLAAPRLGDGSFVRVSEKYLDMPLYSQCWKRDTHHRGGAVRGEGKAHELEAAPNICWSASGTGVTVVL